MTPRFVHTFVFWMGCKLQGQHRLGRGTGWVKSGGIFWFRVAGVGAYRVRGERPYLLLPGRGPKRTRHLL